MSFRSELQRARDQPVKRNCVTGFVKWGADFWFVSTANTCGAFIRTAPLQHWVSKAPRAYIPVCLTRLVPTPRSAC
eukprot:7196894-Pyramimonas_sp.AAC.1